LCGEVVAQCLQKVRLMRRNLRFALSALVALASSCGSTHRDADDPNIPVGGTEAGSADTADAGGGTGGAGGTGTLDGGSGGSGLFAGNGGIGGGIAGVGGEGGVGGDGGSTPIEEPDEPPMCEVRAGDHEAAECIGETCPFATDVVLACNHRRFGEPGVQVAPTPTGAVLFSSSAELTLMLSASGAQGELHELPSALRSKVLMLAQAQDAATFLATNIARVSVYGEEDGTWTPEHVTDSGIFGGPYDFVIAPDGTMHMWITGVPMPSAQHRTRVPGGEWGPAAIPQFGMGNTTRYTLDRDGIPVAVSGMDGTGQALAWQSQARAGSIGPLVETDELIAFRLASPAVPQAGADEPAFAAVIETALGLSVLWPRESAPDGYAQVDVPGTAPVSAPCNWLENFNSCDMDCTDRSITVPGYAIARTGGALWLAWTVTQENMLYDRSEPDPPCVLELLGECFCNTVMVDQGAQTTLHVVRIDLETSERTKVLTLPTLPLQLDHMGAMAYRDRPLLDIRGFGDRLAIGMRTQVAEPGTRAWLAELRLIELDTTAF